MSSANHSGTYQTLATVNLVTTALSLGGCIWMTYQCIRVRAQRTAVKLILAIGLADLIYSLSNVMTPWDQRVDPWFCQAEGFIRQFGMLLSICFATSTATLCYHNSKHDPYFSQRKFVVQAVLISVTSCLALSLPPLFMPQIFYGRIELYCWIKYSPSRDIITIPTGPVNNTINLGIIIVFNIIPIFSGLMMSIIGYTKAIKNYKRIAERHQITGLNNAYRLLWYPTVLFIIFMTVVVDDITQLYAPNPIVWIEIVHIVCFHSMGLVNAVIYGIQTKIWKNAYEDIEPEAGRSFYEETEDTTQA